MRRHDSFACGRLGAQILPQNPKKCCLLLLAEHLHLITTLFSLCLYFGSNPASAFIAGLLCPYNELLS